jgi:hypothetical protein
MRHNRENSIIEIDITNVCHKMCSNCTRFCGHHKKPYYMDFDTFKRAVNSLDGYEGLISTIGGEPLLHPEYSRFAAYLQKKRGKDKLTTTTRGNAILRDYLHYAKFQRWVEASLNAGRGYLLFTSIPRHYYKYFEDVQNTVSDLWLNDHTAISMHQPILISRKDLGIGDEEFAKLRDNCWLQNFWSGTITPKGCFFCEIAGTLDMLFDGPGGKPIEQGWWRQDISEFNDQFHWCDICGMALQTFSRNANEGIDDASPSNYEKLREMNTPKFAKKQVNLVTSTATNNSRLGKDMASVMGNYQPDNDVRIGDVKRNMQPERILRIESLGLPFAKAARNCAEREWLLYAEPHAGLPINFEKLICSRYLNPGYLFRCKFGIGEAVLLSPIAHAAKRLGFDGLRDRNSIDMLAAAWGAKVHVLEPGFEDLPDIDIPYFRDKVFDNYNNDDDFKTRLQQRLQEKGIVEGSNLLVLQSAFVFHTLSIVRLLHNMGHSVYVMSSEKFREYFANWVKNENISYFSDSHFNFTAQSELREELKCQKKFDGAIVPFSFGPSTVKFIDDYTDALRTAENIGGRILGIVNIRRRFVEPEYDIWG